jgi:outer membrane protein OmpA-like peptidoglycan-associated protein
MSRPSLLLTGTALAAVLAMSAPLPAVAQSSDPAALQLIEQLRPRTGTGTRGIRMPTPADAPAPAGATSAAMPAPAPAAVSPPTSVSTPAPRPAAPSAATQAAMPAARPSVSITVTFPSGSATLTPQAERTLAPLGRALASPDLAPYRFRVEGHTDTTGDSGANQSLSERRAEAVRLFLIQQHGVSASRLEAVGLGEARPAVATPDETPEPRNRRVQIVNLDG